MYARVSTIKTSADQIDESIRHFSETSLPQARKLAGFERATLLVNRHRGVTRLLTYWSTRDDLDQSADIATRLRTSWVDSIRGSELVSVETFEVAVDVVGSED